MFTMMLSKSELELIEDQIIYEKVEELGDNSEGELILSISFDRRTQVQDYYQAMEILNDYYN